MPYFVGLFTSRKGDEGIEPVDPAYSRQEVEFTHHGEGPYVFVANIEPISFFRGGVTREHRLTEVGIFDRKEGGRLLHYGHLTSTTYVHPGDNLCFVPGALNLSWTSVPAGPSPPPIRPTAWERLLLDDD